jgi:catalase
MALPQPADRSPWLPLLGIVAIVGALATAFLWTSGRIGGGRVTAQKLIDTIEAGNPEPFPGFRRAHAKGLCVAGTFSSSGEAAALSSARIFAQRNVTPVMGRISIAGNPHGADDAARVRSLALSLRTDDGQEWRTAMNSFPFFVVATPEGFLAQMLASRPDPANGKPDPASQAAFAAKYPEAKKFGAWAAQAPWPNSWANTEFNGIHSYRLRAANGSEHFARWSMRPQARLQTMTPAERKAAGADFLARDLRERLARGPVRWDMLLTLAEAGDAVNDPSQPFPAGRAQVVAGTLEINSATEQASGPCRDVNFDPLILPTGIAASDDPILAARSAVYAESYKRREWEIASGKATEAVGARAAP